MNDKDITILGFSEAGRAALALIEKLREDGEELDTLKAAVAEQLPYTLDDGTDDEASPVEAVEYAGAELRTLRAQHAAEKTRAESAELGCDIAYRREPTQEEGDAHEDKQHQSMGPDLATGECFVSMGGWTGRRCRHCARWTWGGPTACAVCVEKVARDELGIQLAACQERLRLAMDAVRKLKAFRDGVTFKFDEERGVHSLRSIALDLERLWDESDDALAALDAVPGDALQPVSAAYKSGIGPALDRAHEASGVVTGAPFDEPQNGVKGVE